MKSIFDSIREHLDTINYECDITKEDYERLFYRTDERVEFTFQGWDGKSYDGETRTARVIRTNIEGFESVRFIKVGKGLHYVREDTAILEKATGLTHKTVGWLVNVAR